jgi:hypothetical protein
MRLRFRISSQLLSNIRMHRETPASSRCALSSFTDSGPEGIPCDAADDVFPGSSAVEIPYLIDCDTSRVHHAVERGMFQAARPGSPDDRHA